MLTLLPDLAVRLARQIVIGAQPTQAENQLKAA
jgi:hypothetical protein